MQPPTLEEKKCPSLNSAIPAGMHLALCSSQKEKKLIPGAVDPFKKNDKSITCCSRQFSYLTMLHVKVHLEIAPV